MFNEKGSHGSLFQFLNIAFPRLALDNQDWNGSRVDDLLTYTASEKIFEKAV
jgi:hypothetical protein